MFDSQHTHMAADNRVLRRGDDKEEKSWGQEVLHKLCLMLGKLIKKYSIMYVVFRREMGQCQ